MIRSQVFCCYRKLLRQNYAVLFALGMRVEHNVSLFFCIIIVLLEPDCFPIFKKNTVLQVFIFDSRQHFYERLGGNEQEKCGGKGVDDVEREAGRIGREQRFCVQRLRGIHQNGRGIHNAAVDNNGAHAPENGKRRSAAREQTSVGKQSRKKTDNAH